MLGSEVHTNFCADLVWEMQEPQKKTVSVKKCSDYANTFLWNYPFGLTMPGRSANTANPNDNYQFTGHERDDESGLNIYYMIARGMDPVLGRFMQIDPHYFNYRDLSPYAYVGNNLLIFVDPTGMDSVLYIRQTHQSADLTQKQKDQITSQAQSVFDQNGVPMTVEFVSLDSDGNAQFVFLDPADVRIDLVDDNNPALKTGKADGNISQDTEETARRGSQEGLVTVDAMTRNNVNETGIGNLVVHEGLHAMGLAHEDIGTNIMNSQPSGRQVYKSKQTIVKKHVSFIKNKFLTRN